MDRTSDFQQLLNGSRVDSSRSNVKNRKKNISFAIEKQEKMDKFPSNSLNSSLSSSSSSAINNDGSIFLQNCLSVLRELRELSLLLDAKMTELKNEPLFIMESQFEEEFRSATLLSHIRIANLKENFDNLVTIYQLERVDQEGFIYNVTLGLSSWISKKFHDSSLIDDSNSNSSNSQLLLHYELILGHVRRRHGIILENLEKLKTVSEERMDRKRRILTKAIHPIDIHKTPSTLKHPMIITRPDVNFPHSPTSNSPSSASFIDAEAVKRGKGHTLSTIEFQEKYGLSQSQMMELAQSSDILLEEFNALNKELDSTEASILRIGQLQGMLQENLLIQQSLGERICDDAMDALTSVRKGNEQIGMAAQRPSTFRMVMIVLILSVTLVILFMHWYND